MKYLSKMRKLRVISMILCIAMMAMSIPMTVTALDDPSTTEEAPASTVATATDAPKAPESTWTPTIVEETLPGIGEKTIAELQTMRVEDVELPETITLETARQKGHVNRLYEQETDLQTVIFQNQSGNMTAYIYDRPVKYIDANGTVRDKDTAIAVSPLAGYAYAMTDNSVRVYFASNATDGVMVQYGDAAIIMRAEPSLLVSTVSLGDEDNVVLYNHAFGARTVLRYQTQLNGVKEDIILLSNVGKNTFNFHLTMQGVTPVEENGEWKLINENDETVMTFSRIKINDSAGKTVYGTLDIVPAANGYTMTVTAPQEFLSASDTVYPVYIDPTVQSWEYNTDTTTMQEYEAIIDQGLYATQAAADAASDPTKHNLNSETGRVIYKFSDFYRTNGRFLSYTNEYRIGRATMHVTLGAGNAGTISAMPLNASWNSDDTSAPLYSTSLWNAGTQVRYSYTVVPAEAGEYGIDITDVVRGWTLYNAGTRGGYATDPSKGFVMQSYFSGTRTVNSVEADSPFDVWYTIDYSARGGVYYMLNGHYGNRYLTKNESTSISSLEGPLDRSLWLIDYVGEDQYLISNAYDQNYFLNATPSTAEVYAPTPWEYPEAYYWEFVNADVGMRIKNVSTGQVLYAPDSAIEMVNPSTLTTTNQNYASWLLTFADSYVPLTYFSVRGSSWVNVGAAFYATITPTPSNASFTGDDHFIWRSSDTTVATVSSSGYIQAKAVGSCIISVTHKNTRLVNSFYIVVGQLLQGGTYCIYNMRSNNFVSLNGASPGEKEPIIQKIYHGNSWMHWEIEYLQSGFYSIKSAESGKYLAIDGQEVCQSTALDAKSRWFLRKSNSGNFIFYSQAGNGTQAISISNNDASGTSLKHRAYMNDANLGDEWGVYLVEYTAVVNNYYDEGYLVRYGLTDAQAKKIIRDFNIEVAVRYLQLFGLSIQINPVNTYTSCADTCKGIVTTANVGARCTHENAIHSQRSTLISEFNSTHAGSETVTNILWSGHYIESVTGGYTYANRSCSSSTSIFMLTLDTGSVQLDGILMHELAHQYGAVDHYHELDANNQCIIEHCSRCVTQWPEDCIMVVSQQDISSVTIMCGSCWYAIRSHLRAHHRI